VTVSTPGASNRVSNSSTPVTRAPGRPRTPVDVAEAQALHRVADLASAVMNVLRQPRRGRYNSELELREWLRDSNIAFTSKDLPAALALLASTGRLHRVETVRSSSRGGWIAPTVEWTTETPVAASRNGEV
jgi:hypothetical protein